MRLDNNRVQADQHEAKTFSITLFFFDEINAYVLKTEKEGKQHTFLSPANLNYFLLCRFLVKAAFFPAATALA